MLPDPYPNFMYSYRVKVPTFLLGTLLFVMLINVVGNYRLSAKITRVPLDPLGVQSEEAFAAQAATLTDPAELRALVIKEHRRVVAADHLLSTVNILFKSLGRSLLWQTWGVMILGLCYYLFEYRTPR